MERKFGDYGGFEYAGSYDDITEMNDEQALDEAAEKVEKVERVEEPIEMTREQSQGVGKEVLNAMSGEAEEKQEEPVEAKAEVEEKVEMAAEKTLKERVAELRDKVMAKYGELKSKLAEADLAKLARRGVGTALLIAKLGTLGVGDGREAKAEEEEVIQEPRIEQQAETASFDDDEEDYSIEDVLEPNYVAPELERQEVNGAEFITDGTKEVDGIGEVRTFKYIGGHIKENNPFYVDGKRKEYAYGASFKGETLVERFEEWEMSLAMEPKALAVAVDQFNLEAELGIPEFKSIGDADAWADMVATLPADEYDSTVNAAVARILNKFAGIKTSRECNLARDMRDVEGSPTESEGEDDVETFGQLRTNKNALQMTFVNEAGENVCSDPEAFQHLWDSLTPEQQAQAKKVGSTAWVNIGEFGEKKNGGLAGNWEFKEGERVKPTLEPESPTATPEPENPTATPEPENPTPTPEESPTPEPEVTPTSEPDPEVTPTSEPVITPTPEPVITPTPTPEPTPTSTPVPPTPTPTPVPTPTPTPVPTPTPEPKPTKDPEAIEGPIDQVEQEEHVEIVPTGSADEQPQTERPESIGERTEPETTSSPDELAAQLADLGL